MKKYEIEDVTKTKMIGDKLYYRIKWAGYKSKDNTWEP